MVFIQLAQNDPKFYLIWVFLVIFSVCAHEYAHAQVALWLGDSTAAERGHLTLNPWKQMGLYSWIALAILGICWGNIPVDYRKLKTKSRIAIAALSGPLTNLVLFLISCAIVSFLIVKSDTKPNASVVQFFAIGGMLNMALALFNLIPAPPLDGWVIVSIFFPKLQKLNPEVRNGAIFALFILLFFSFNKLFFIGEFCVSSTISAMVEVISRF